MVIGAGPAGLATAGALRHHGIGAVVLESDSIGASWRKHYDRLHLHTVRWLSHLPGYKMPRRYGRWVGKDDVAEYLGDYAAHSGVRPRFGVEVRRLVRDGDGWCAETDAGPLRARQVVLASGYNREPVQPSWPGQESFRGTLIHASGATS